MISEASIGDHRVAAEIYALAQTAYALEAEWIGCADFPPLRESLQELQQCGDTFLVFRQSRAIVAALSFVRDAAGVLITRLVVSPQHLRCGIATALLEELERRLPESVHFAVVTAAANVPAVHLYRQQGYRPMTTNPSREGIPLLRFEKSKAEWGKAISRMPSSARGERSFGGPIRRKPEFLSCPAALKIGGLAETRRSEHF
jgi:GNAT superfamily N-acetyltransferase